MAGQSRGQVMDKIWNHKLSYIDPDKSLNLSLALPEFNTLLQ